MKITPLVERGLLRCIGHSPDDPRVFVNFTFRRQEDGDAELEHNGVKYENPTLDDEFVREAFNAVHPDATLVEWELTRVGPR
jgi:hypothetical protein